MARPPKPVDWKALQRDWETTRATLGTLKKRYGLSVGYIARKAKELGWADRGTVTAIPDAVAEPVPTPPEAPAPSARVGTVLPAVKLMSAALRAERQDRQAADSFFGLVMTALGDLHKAREAVLETRSLRLGEARTFIAALKDAGVVLESAIAIRRRLHNRPDGSSDRFDSFTEADLELFAQETKGIIERLEARLAGAG
jgi:hypothetical protein